MFLVSAIAFFSFENLFFRFDSAEKALRYSVPDIKKIDYVVEEENFTYFFFREQDSSFATKYATKDNKGWRVLDDLLQWKKFITTEKYSIMIHKIKEENKTMVFCYSNIPYESDVIKSIEDSQGSVFSSFSRVSTWDIIYYYTILDNMNVDDYYLIINENEKIDVGKADFLGIIDNG